MYNDSHQIYEEEAGVQNVCAYSTANTVFATSHDLNLLCTIYTLSLVPRLYQLRTWAKGEPGASRCACACSIFLRNLEKLYSLFVFFRVSFVLNFGARRIM